MDNALFYDSFRFFVYERRTAFQSDFRKGIQSHFLARLRSGRLRIACESGESLEVSAGELFYLPIGLRYQSFWEKGEEDAVIAWDSCSFVYFPERGELSFPMQKLTATEEERDIIDSLCEASLINTQSVGRFYQLLGSLMLRMQQQERDPRAQLRERILAFIRLHPVFKVAELARACCMSESTLFLYFKTYLHTTPVALKWQILAERAETMLCCTDATVEEIALELGFESCAHFRKIFKHQYGQTPSEVRRQNKNRSGI